MSAKARGDQRKIEIVEYDAVSGEQKILAACVMAADGKITVHGSEPMVARLKSGIYSPARRAKVTPDDGNDFLEAILLEFKSIHLFAREVT